MIRIIKSFLKAIIAGWRAFEKELSNDIYNYRYQREMKRRKAFNTT